MSSTVYWVWLQLCIGADKDFFPILNHFGTIESLYDANIIDCKECDSLTDKIIERMNRITLDDAQGVIDCCDENNWRVFSYDDDNYPEKLRNIDKPPAVIYVCGKMPDIDQRLSIGVVGTRKASPYAVDSARVLSKGIARCGGVVVSGGAQGVDSASHTGALEAQGDTVVVLGCGLATAYMNHNPELRERLLNVGTILTEYPPKTVATRFTFPQRNRIISGLSDGVLVVEAGVKSGTLITADYAKEQGRELFAVPSSILDINFEGTNRLISEGAIVAVDTASIVSQYADIYDINMSKVATNQELMFDKYQRNDEQITFENIDTHRNNRIKIEENAMELKGSLKAVYDALGDDFADLSTIGRQSNLDAKDVLTSLTLLELRGLAEAGVGSRYRKKQS